MAQSIVIRYRCGHEKALPFDETGEDLRRKVETLQGFLCMDCKKEELRLATVKRNDH